jgi:hypothetical protein
MKVCARVGLILVSIGAVTPVLMAQEYYRQDPIPDGLGGYSSQDARNSGGLGWFSEVADNFPGQAGWSINHVQFWGSYTSDPATPGHTHGFTVRFYTDNNGNPGTRIYEQDVLTFSEIQYYLSPPLPPVFPNGIASYHYELDLATPFAITGNAQYWMSVVAILDRGGNANEPQWSWIQAMAVNPPSAEQWFFMPGNFQPTGVDESFVISNTGTSCRADVNHDGVVNVQDFLAFLQLYAAGDAGADFDGNGSINVQDFLAFLSTYAAGCP